MSIVKDQIAVMHPHNNRTWLSDFLWYIDIAIDLATRWVGLVSISLCFGDSDNHFCDRIWEKQVDRKGEGEAGVQVYRDYVFCR